MKPSEEFTIHVLDDKDYELLPYPGARDSLGMSVMATKTAYIRKTGIDEVDRGTISHEFDELMAKTSPHEINGIRYKGFKDIIRTVFNVFLPGTGSAIFGAPTPPVQEIKFTPQQATSAFSPAPQSAASPAPLSETQFNQGLTNIESNRTNRKADVFNTFRDLGTPQQNSAFNTQLKNVGTSSDLNRQQFIDDQEQRKRLV